MRIAILTIVFLTTGGLNSIAGEYQPGFSASRTCTRNEYREEYVPGTRNNPGYVKKWEETVEVPCQERQLSKSDTYKLDNNDCSEGSIAGGILGGGLATAISRGKDRWWSIPTGIVGGSMIGCQIDGG